MQSIKACWQRIWVGIFRPSFLPKRGVSRNHRGSQLCSRAWCNTHPSFFCGNVYTPQSTLVAMHQRGITRSPSGPELIPSHCRTRYLQPAPTMHRRRSPSCILIAGPVPTAATAFYREWPPHKRMIASPFGHCRSRHASGLERHPQCITCTPAHERP